MSRPSRPAEEKGPGRVDADGQGLDLQAPAKVNLCLRVIRRREDGYHEIESLFQPLELADRIILGLTQRPGVSLDCPGSDLPCDSRNLAFRAAEAFLEETGARSGLSIILHKRIPIAAGLGGGSTDAAAVLKGADRLFGGALGPERLARLALGLGADVPFFLECRSAWARGVGEILTPAELPNFHYVLVNPPFPVSAASAYSALRKPLTLDRGLAKFSCQKTVYGGFEDLAREELVNDLEAVVAAAHPLVSRIREELVSAGADLAMMSGSGPTVFGLFGEAEEAEAAAARLKAVSAQEDGSWRVILTRGLA